MSQDGSNKHRATRRDFLKTAVLTGAAGYWVGGRGAWAAAADATTRPTTSPNSKINLGIIGVAGRATGNLDEENNAIANENIVAICDVDSTRLGKVGERFAKAERYADFRKLLERRDIDAVVISTPDHTHAPATLIALNGGKHVYCEKPLTHTVEEARRVTEAAAKNKRITQMGTQIHAGGNYRRVVEMIQGGAIGAVNEVHVWVGTNWSSDKPPTPAEVPANLDFDLWQGPVVPRPFAKEYHPENWRRWWAFGNGTLGDMGCHFFDLPFWALKLRHPTRISAEGPAVHAEGCPTGLIAHYAFPARGDLPPVKLTWYDGGKKPPMAAEWGVPKTAGSGVVFIGEKGKLFADYNQKKLLPAEDFADFKPPAKLIPDSIGHHREWLEAIRGSAAIDSTTCNFDYAGALAETVLLGTVAFRAGKEIEWDAKQLKIANAPQAEQFLRTEYRKGWDM